MAIRGNAQSITEKWAQRTAGATQQVVEGVQRVTEAPGMKAARQGQAYLNGVQAKFDKWKTNTAGVSLGEWQAATTAGAQRISAGVQAKKGKMEAHLRDFLPYVERVQAQVNNMPRGDLNQNLARMMENARQLAQYKRPAR